jgi:hypothetical protein
VRCRLAQNSVSYLWREPDAAKGFTTGVSLHSHTSQSRETLDFIAELSTDFSLLQPLMRWAEARAARSSGIRPDYSRAFWTPPLTPRLAFDLERSQVEQKLGLNALVSLSDHDDISAPMLLRSVASARHIPVSVEWSVPYTIPAAAPDQRPTAFHLGIHNLPSGSAAAWIERLNTFTATPLAARAPGLLQSLLEELHALPGVLIVFNHPLWDLFRIGQHLHDVLVNDFLATLGQFIHALELNGLRDWTENRSVQALARQWNQLVISGGDRHGVEPNANLNLTDALDFTGFVHQVRQDRISHVLFMPQYRQPWKHRILESTLDAIRDYPHFPEGFRRWDERVFSPDRNGEIKPLSTLWPSHQGRPGTPPAYITALLAGVKLLGRAPVSGGLRLAWNDRTSMRASLAHLDA